MIGLEMRGLSGATRGVGGISAAVERATPEMLDEAAEQFKSFWQFHLSGPASKSKLGIGKSGGLRASIQIDRSGKGRKIGTPVKYARIHEEGDTIKAKRVQYLHFKVGKPGAWQWVRVKEVTIPKRPHFAPAVKDATPVIEAIFDGRMAEAVDRAVGIMARVRDEQWARMGEVATLGGTGRRTYQLTS